MRGVELTSADREEVRVGIECGRSGREIARRLGRDCTVVNREIKRHGGRSGYRAVAAQEEAVANRSRPKSFKVESHPGLLGVVNAGLGQGWSVGADLGEVGEGSS